MLLLLFIITLLLLLIIIITYYYTLYRWSRGARGHDPRPPYPLRHRTDADLRNRPPRACLLTALLRGARGNETRYYA